MGRWTWIAGVVALVAQSAGAHFMRPDQVPVERLERNIRAYVKAHPNDAQGYYTLGRVHYLTVATRTGTVGVYQQRGKGAAASLPNLAADELQTLRNETGKGKGKVTAMELAGHVRGAVENLWKAIELDSNNALYHLTLASVLEATPGDVAYAMGGYPPGDAALVKEWPADVVERARGEIEKLADKDEHVRDVAMAELRKMGAPAVAAVMAEKDAGSSPEQRVRSVDVVKGFWEERAAGEYVKAYELAVAKDRNLPTLPMLGSELVSYEAGTQYVALTDRRPRTEAEEAMAREMKETIKELKAKPPGPITPIVLSLEGASGLKDLVDERARVRFDLDGTARGWEWSWVRPGAGVLVWDPSHQGRIESGRQLFGNVTFGLFWRDGYQALASLDDDGDGELAGKELEGLAVWFDRNGDGVSQPGEMVRIGDVGITGLAVKAAGVDGVSPYNVHGMRMRDGRVLATYDWVASPVGK